MTPIDEYPVKLRLYYFDRDAVFNTDILNLGVDGLYISTCKAMLIFLTMAVLVSSATKLIDTSKALRSIKELPLIMCFMLIFLLNLVATNNLMAVYISMEGLGLVLYCLCSLLASSSQSLEASLKYFTLGAVATSFYLYGCTIIYMLIGSFDFTLIRHFFVQSDISYSLTDINISAVCILFGLLVKLGAFPGHIWVCDVYSGAWLPVTTIFVIVIKVGYVLLFIHLVVNVFFGIFFILQPLIIVSAIGSIFFGGINALRQTKITSFVAYTSINQVGFILIGVACGTFEGFVASLAYLFLYVIVSLSFFHILLNSHDYSCKRSPIYLSDLRYIVTTDKELGLHACLSLFSMAGIPPLGGFFTKYFLYCAALSSGLDSLVIASQLVSVISIYYYLKFAQIIGLNITLQKRAYMHCYTGTKKSLIYLRLLSFFIIFGGFILLNFDDCFSSVAAAGI